MRRTVTLSLLLIATLLRAADVPDPEESRILTTRERVWRAWFADDEATLHMLVPVNAVVISPGEQDWKTQAQIIESARDFHRGGGELLNLTFGRTVVQRYGNAAFVYSSFSLTLRENGKTSTSHGRATEVFVLKKGQWLNPGWHTDRE